jgi:L-rhamnose isomerase
MSDTDARLQKTRDEFHNYWLDHTIAVRQIDWLTHENNRLRAALEKIALHDMQALAMDALRPGKRISAKQAGTNET